MKAFNVILLLLFGASCMANDIDKLRTNEEVSTFLIKKISRKFKEFPLLDNNAQVPDSAAFGRNTFFKTDVDNNGLTDLIIYGSKLVAIMDKGGNEYQVRYLDRGPYLPHSVNLVSIDTATLPRKIIVQQFKRDKSEFDTLVYLFNSFIEYNSAPAEALNLEKITFKTNRCFGECPVFEMTINKDRTALYKAILYNEQTGEFTGTIPRQDFEDLLLLLKYLPLNKIRNAYTVSWTDDQTAFTEINYDGKIKAINDYGEIGTYGLSMLYLKFLRWRTSVDWTE